MNNRDSQNSNTAITVSQVLSGMISQLESSNQSLASQISNSVNKTATGSSGSSSVAGALLNAVNPVSSSRSTNILTSLFLGPLWRGLFSLFGGGGGDQQEVPLTRYTFPAATQTAVGATLRADGGTANLRTDAFGLSQATPAPQQSINISIQALDARSIVDRSDDIAAALKQALLSNHEINDSLGEL
jgi:hypothetical protein